MENQPASKTTSQSKRLEGMVVSHAMQKTVMVQVNRLVSHPTFGKRIRHRSKFMAHDEKSEAKTGDRVLIVETRPLSKLKRWRVVKILAKAAGA